MPFREVLQGVRSLLLASHCLGCRRPFFNEGSGPLCLHCIEKLPRASRSLQGSGRRLSLGEAPPPGGTFLDKNEGEATPGASAHRTGFDQVISRFLYEGDPKELILALKYHGRLSLAPFLGKLLAEAITEQLGVDPADGIVPVPLYPTRMRERGFNQALVLAQGVAKALHLPCIRELLVRYRPTQPQAGLSREERFANVQDAFSLHPDPCLVRGKRILLVDDVFTTGATAEACAKLLKQAGAITVTVATIAHG